MKKLLAFFSLIPAIAVAQDSTPISYQSDPNNFVKDVDDNNLGAAGFTDFLVAFGYFPSGVDLSGVANDDPPASFDSLFSSFVVLDSDVNSTATEGAFAGSENVDVTQAGISGSSPTVWLFEGVSDVSAVDFSGGNISSQLLMVSNNTSFPSANDLLGFSVIFGSDDGTETDTEIVLGEIVEVGGFFDLQTATVVPEPSTYAMIAGALILGFAYLRRRRA